MHPEFQQHIKHSTAMAEEQQQKESLSIVASHEEEAIDVVNEGGSLQVTDAGEASKIKDTPLNKVRFESLAALSSFAADASALLYCAVNRRIGEEQEAGGRSKEEDRQAQEGGEGNKDGDQESLVGETEEEEEENQDGNVSGLGYPQAQEEFLQL